MNQPDTEPTDLSPSESGPSLNWTDHLEQIAKDFNLPEDKITLKFEPQSFGRFDFVTRRILHKTQNGTEADAGEMMAASGTVEQKAEYDFDRCSAGAFGKANDRPSQLSGLRRDLQHLFQAA